MCPALLRACACVSALHGHSATRGRNGCCSHFMDVETEAQRSCDLLRFSHPLVTELGLGLRWPGSSPLLSPAPQQPSLLQNDQATLPLPGSCVTPSLQCQRKPSIRVFCPAMWDPIIESGPSASPEVAVSGARVERGDPSQPPIFQSLPAEVNTSLQRLERGPCEAASLAFPSPPALKSCHITPRGRFAEALSW